MWTWDLANVGMWLVMAAVVIFGIALIILHDEKK